MDPRTKRLCDEAEARLVAQLQPQKSGRWTLADVRRVHAGSWDLYREGSAVNAPGEVVCRHVAAALAIMLRQDGYRAWVDSFYTKRVPGSPYGGHATLIVKLGDVPYYVESQLVGSHHVASASAVAASRRGFDGTELEGLPMTLDGSKAVDVGWMDNRSFGRNLTSFRNRVSDRTLSAWHREYQRQMAHVRREVREGRAAGLVGSGLGKRKVLA